MQPSTRRCNLILNYTFRCFRSAKSFLVFLPKKEKTIWRQFLVVKWNRTKTLGVYCVSLTLVSLLFLKTSWDFFVVVVVNIRCSYVVRKALALLSAYMCLITTRSQKEGCWEGSEDVFLLSLLYREAVECVSLWKIMQTVHTICLWYSSNYATVD